MTPAEQVDRWFVTVRARAEASSLASEAWVGGALLVLEEARREYQARCWRAMPTTPCTIN